MAKSGYKGPDSFSKKAKKDGFAARSVYKLEEINNKYKFLKKGFKVLDLGAFPGSWSQYALGKVGRQGRVVGIDIQNMKKSLGSNYNFFHKSILDADLDLSEFAPFHVVISDMAPNTTGIKGKDSYESVELCEMAVEIAKKHMKREGTFVCKVFQGEEFDDFYKDIKQVFKKIKSYKPVATRNQSKEIYVIGWGLK